MQHIINLQLLANNTNFSKFKSFDSTAKVYEIDLFANKKLASLNQQPTRLIDRAKKAFSAGVQIGGTLNCLKGIGGVRVKMLVYKAKNRSKTEAKGEKDLLKLVASLEALAGRNKLEFRLLEEEKDAASFLKRDDLKSFVILSPDNLNIKKLASINRKVFTIILDNKVCNSAGIRLKSFTLGELLSICEYKQSSGVHMISDDFNSVRKALNTICSWQAEDKKIETYSCPRCQYPNLNLADLRTHYFMFHAAEPGQAGKCPACSKLCPINTGGIAVHLHNSHGKLEEREPLPPEFAAFSWIICFNPKSHKFLLINEPAPICQGIPKYWFPAGRVDSGESFSNAAERETLEEAGVKIIVKGVLKFMLDNCPRVVFLAHPEDPEATPKAIPDYESVGAMWISIEQIEAMDDNLFRSRGSRSLFLAFANGYLEEVSVNNKEFQLLEKHMSRLTANYSLGGEKKFIELWDTLHKVYPPSNFDEKYRDIAVYGTSPM